MSRPISALIRENAVLIAGAVLPLLLVALFAISRAIPESNVPDPQYKAVYSVQPYYGGYNFSTSVNSDGKMEITFRLPKDAGYTGDQNQKMSVYIFDGAKGSVETIEVGIPDKVEAEKTIILTPDKFSALTVSGKEQSPDGYEYKPDSYSYGTNLVTELFTYRSRHQPAGLVKEGRRIPLKPDNVSYGGSFKFIGWVTKE